MAGTDRLIFPIEFDLESAVRKASGDADKVLKQLETALRARPLKLDVDIDTSGYTLSDVKAFQNKISQQLAKDGSIENLRTQMSALVEQWNKLSEAERVADRTTGEYTGKAKQIIDEFSRLTAATRSYAQGLEQIIAASDKAANAEIRKNEKAQAALDKLRAKQQQRRDILAAEETSIANVAAKIKVYQEVADKYDFGTKAYRLATSNLERLGAQMERLKAIMNTNTGNSGKDQYGFEKLRETLRGSESTIEQVKAKLNAVNYVLANVDQNSFTWRRMTEEGARLNGVLDEMKRKQNDVTNATRIQAKQLEDMRKKEDAHDKAKGERAALQIANERRKAAGLLTKEQEKQQKMLNSTSKSVQAITAKLDYYQQKLNRQEFGSNGFKKTAEQIRQLTKELEAYQKEIDRLTGKKGQVNALSNEFRKQETYISRLVKRLAVYAGFSQIMGFIRNVREVTAQFELQRISLGAILQDQTKANQLFSEIKQFALKSPVKILDLTKYTKQLAAYKIGYDELFETTKKLTDVSVGLGVSMDRVVLAYGQVRATGHLRASEIRQFTEMGVPIVEELAAKLSKMNGELVTSAQVMDMVSKRAISFDLVKEVFDDMTSAGGIFYNMQEKQGNTLYGMWAKLGDAASVMYEQIGNTGWVNTTMKGMIEATTNLMRNWRTAGWMITAATAGLAAYIAKQKISNYLENRKTNGTKRDRYVAAIDEKAAKATERRANAEARLNAANASGTIQDKARAAAALRTAKAHEQAALAEKQRVHSMSKFALGWKSFVSGIGSSMGWGLAIAGVSALAGWLSNLYEKSHRLQNQLKQTREEMGVMQSQSVQNFQSLADKAVKSPEGSREQKEALEELIRTYREIIPEQELTIEKLKAMNGNYESVNAAIREHIRLQQLQKGTNELQENLGKDIENQRRDALKVMTGNPLSLAGLDGTVKRIRIAENQVTRMLENVRINIQEKGQNMREALINAFNMEGFDYEKSNAFSTREIMKYAMALESAGREIDKFAAQMQPAYAELGMFAKAYENMQKRIKDHVFVNTDETSFLHSLELQNTKIREMQNTLAAALQMSGVKITDESNHIKKEYQDLMSVLNNVGADGKTSTINFTAIDALVEKIKTSAPQLAYTLQNLVNQLKEDYNALVPSDPIVRAVYDNLIKIADGAKVGIDKMQRYLWDGKTAIADHLKTLKDSAEKLEAEIYKYSNYIKLFGTAGKTLLKMLGVDVDALTAEYDLLTEQIKYVQSYVKEDEKKDKGSKSDTRLQELQEINQTLEKINKEYDDLSKKEGKTKALEDIKKQFKDTLDYTNRIGKKFGLHFDYPTEFKSLQQYRNEILKVMKSLKGLKGGEKAILQFQTMIDKADSDELQKQIEKQLKDLADRISRTKTAREFYEKILGQTGDVELAANVTFSIYGENGEGLQKEMDEYVAKLFGDYKITIPKIKGTDKIDYLGVKRLAKQALDAKQIGEDAYKDIIKIAEDGQKDLAKIAEQGAKLLLTYDEIAQKRVNIEQEASDKIRQLREAEALYLASNATPEQKQAYSNRTNKAVKGVESKRDLNLLKLKDEYLRFFSAIHSLTKKEANKLRGEVRQALFKAFQDGAISADELKRELKAIDEQFNKLIKDQGKFVSYLDGGFEGLISRLRDMSDEMMSVGSEIGKMNSVDQISEGQKSFIDTMLKQFGNDQTGNSFASLLQNTNGDLSEMGSLLEGVSGEMGAMAEGGASALVIVDRIIKDVAATIEGIAAIRDQLNELRSEDHQLEGWGWDAFEYLENFNKYAAQGWEDLKNGNIVGAVQNTVQSIISIFNTAHAQKVKRLNKQIKEQERLLEDLEYTYSRLEVAMEKAFGADYINNFKQQQENLEAQAAAYQKQAELERAKGKSADEDKIREYEAAYRDVMDEIADMQGEIAAQMLGTDLTSAARDFAKAWLDAYKEFSKTSDAMSEKFKEMIENMVVEGALAKVMERALQPMFDMIDNMNEEDFYSESFWKQVVAKAEQGAKDADYGATTMVKFLEQAGISVRDLGGDLTGTSRDIANASEESINGLAASTNTQNFYIAQILDEVRLIRMGGSADLNMPSVDYTPLIQQSLENQGMMIRYQAETLAECQKIAVSCKNQADNIQRIIFTEGGKQKVRIGY